jgi:hypothetical protein
VRLNVMPPRVPDRHRQHSQRENREQMDRAPGSPQADFVDEKGGDADYGHQAHPDPTDGRCGSVPFGAVNYTSASRKAAIAAKACNWIVGEALSNGASVGVIGSSSVRSISLNLAAAQSASFGGIVGFVHWLIIGGCVLCSQLLFAASGGRMRHGKSWSIVVLLVTALAADAFAAPKRAKKPQPKPSPTNLLLIPSQSTFVTYEVGTLRLTGKSSKDTTYSIGTLRLLGRSHASTVFNVGTLSMTGRSE